MHGLGVAPTKRSTCNFARRPQRCSATLRMASGSVLVPLKLEHVQQEASLLDYSLKCTRGAVYLYCTGEPRQQAARGDDQKLIRPSLALPCMPPTASPPTAAFSGSRPGAANPPLLVSACRANGQ